MSAGLAKAFEAVSGWVEYSHFEQQEEGYITQERTGDALVYFLWRVDKEPTPLEHTFIDGSTFVRYANNAH
jgi:hypothetical protein